MGESVHFDFFFISVEASLLAIVLPEGMQLVDEEISIWLEHALRLAEYEIQVRNVFQHQVANDEVKELRLKIPGLTDVHQRKVDIVCLHFFLCLFDHAL